MPSLDPLVYPSLGHFACFVPFFIHSAIFDDGHFDPWRANVRLKKSGQTFVTLTGGLSDRPALTDGLSSRPALTGGLTGALDGRPALTGDLGGRSTYRQLIRAGHRHVQPSIHTFGRMRLRTSAHTPGRPLIRDRTPK